MRIFSLDEWTIEYEPDLLNSNYNDSLCDVQTPVVYDHNASEDADVIAKTDTHLVWTLTENPVTGQWSIVSGLQRENILGYLVTKKPHDGEVITVTIDTATRHIQTVLSA